MRAIKAARRLIEDDPDTPAAKVLAELVLSLAEERPFRVNDLYELPPEQFDLALEVLRDWRLDRYSIGKARLFDLSWQLGRSSDATGSPVEPGAN